MKNQFDISKINNLVLLLCCFLATQSNAQSWILKNPLPTNSDLFDVYMLNHDTGFVCGSFQTILKTEDGGLTWHQTSDVAENNLNGMTFSCPDTGFVVGWGGSILRSADGGESWTTLPQPFSSYPTDLTDVFFLDSRHGWICGTYNSILRTADGGVTWNVLSHNVWNDIYLKYIKFSSPDTGYVAGGTLVGEIPHLRRTTDGGITFSDVQVPSEITDVSGLEVLNSNDLWIGSNKRVYTPNGSVNRVYHSTDGGMTWQPHDIEVYGEPPVAIKFFDSLHGWVLCRSSKIYSTNDGGQTWVGKSLGSYFNSMTDMSWPDNQKCMVVGYSGNIYGSGDGGQNWNEVSKGIKDSFLAISFINENTGCVVGYNYNLPSTFSIYRTIDNGNTWLPAQIDSAVSGQLKAIKFSDEHNGWTVGYWGKVLHTTDGGISWNTVHTGFNNSYNALEMKTNKYLWAGGYGGNMIRSLNYGASWEDISIPFPDYDIKSIVFPDSMNGYLIMMSNVPLDSGMMFKTSNGGLSWIPVDYVNMNKKRILSLSFPSVNNGFISVSPEGVSRTSDGGQTWQLLGKIDGVVPTFLQFSDSLHGIAVSGDNFLAETQDGGQSWQVLIRTSPSADYIQGYYFSPDLENGWLTAWRGLIKYYNSNITAIIPVPDHSTDKPFLYPVPACDKLQLQFGINIIEAKLYDLHGSLLKTFSEDRLKSIDVGDLHSGIYFLQLKTRSQTYPCKFIKK